MDEQRRERSWYRERYVPRYLDVCSVKEVVPELTICHPVHNIIQKIGYPTKSPDIRDSFALEKYYASVNINSTAFFANELSIREFIVKREWSALGKPTNRDEWGMTADTVNVCNLSSGVCVAPP